MQSWAIVPLAQFDSPAVGFSRQPAGTEPLELLVLLVPLHAAAQLVLPQSLSAVPGATPFGNSCSQFEMQVWSSSHASTQLKMSTQSVLSSHAVSCEQHDVFAHVTQDVSVVAAAQAPVPPDDVVPPVDDVTLPDDDVLPKIPPPLLLDVPVPVEVPLHATSALNAKNPVTPTA